MPAQGTLMEASITPSTGRSVNTQRGEEEDTPRRLLSVLVKSSAQDVFLKVEHFSCCVYDHRNGFGQVPVFLSLLKNNLN